MIFTGGCHCGDVCFEVEVVSPRLTAYDCNCSLCAKTGFLHLIVPATRFRLLRGADKLTTYQFGQRIAKHLFCRTCGIKSYYVPRSNPDGFSVNVRCLDGVDLSQVEILPFDGKNWESAPDLSGLSKE